MLTSAAQFHPSKTNDDKIHSADSAVLDIKSTIESVALGSRCLSPKLSAPHVDNGSDISSVKGEVKAGACPCLHARSYGSALPGGNPK